MPKGAYTQKQERKADHIAEGYRKEGVSKKEAEERAWRTVNKQDKGGKNDGSGRSQQPLRGREEGLGNAAPARQRLARQPLEDFDPAFERAQFAVRQLRRCGLPASCRQPAAGSAGPARFGQPELQAAAIVGVGLPVDQSGADQRIDRPADGRRAALHPARRPG